MHDIIQRCLDEKKNIFNEKTLKADEADFLKRLLDTDLARTCAGFVRDPTINPITNRSIKQGNFIHLFLSNLCMRDKMGHVNADSHMPKDMTAYIKQFMMNYQVNSSKVQSEISTLTNKINMIQDQHGKSVTELSQKISLMDQRITRDLEALRQDVKTSNDPTERIRQAETKLASNIDEVRQYVNEYADYNKKVYKAKNAEKWFGKKQEAAPLSPRTKRAEELKKKAEEDKERRRKEQEEIRRKADEERKRRKEQEDREKNAAVQKRSKNLEVIKSFYISECTSVVESGKAIDRRMVLLKFHPDKLPQDIKEITRLDQDLSSYVSHIFDQLKSQSERRQLTVADVKNVVSNTKVGGTRRRNYY
jgi:DNA repair exonuclease SbcCD ATPase subunit